MDNSEDMKLFSQCSMINKLLPLILKNIAQIQLLDKKFLLDTDLKTAESNLLQLIDLDSSDKNSAYLEGYKEDLFGCLKSLETFLLNAAKLSDDFLTEEQNKIFMKILQELIEIEEEITKITA